MANKPEKKFRAGAISATIWLNPVETDKGIANFRTISLSRGYKDAGGIWKDSTSLRINDIPKAVLVLNKAYEYIVTTPVEGNKYPEPDAAPLEEEVI